jgi:hypothetical protein
VAPSVLGVELARPEIASGERTRPTGTVSVTLRFASTEGGAGQGHTLRPTLAISPTHDLTASGTIPGRWRFRAMGLFRDPLVLLIVAAATATAFFAVLVSM